MKQIYAENYRQIGLKIAYYRKLRGLTQEELAEATGLTPAFIGHLEAPNIIKALSLDTLFDIASVLNVSPSKFLDFEDLQPNTLAQAANPQIVQAAALSGFLNIP